MASLIERNKDVLSFIIKPNKITIKQDLYYDLYYR